MPKLTIAICDICHAIKGETNHWYVLSGHNGALLLEPLVSADPVAPSLRYLCSRNCVFQALSGWMNGAAPAGKQPVLAGRRTSPSARPLTAPQRSHHP